MFSARCLVGTGMPTPWSPCLWNVDGWTITLHIVWWFTTGITTARPGSEVACVDGVKTFANGADPRAKYPEDGPSDDAETAFTDSSGDVPIGGSQSGASLKESPSKSSQAKPSLAKSKSSSTAVAGDLDLDLACRRANELLNASRTFDRQWAWNWAWVAETIQPGMVSDIVARIRDGGIRKHKAYVEKSVKSSAMKLASTSLQRGQAFAHAHEA